MKKIIAILLCAVMLVSICTSFMACECKHGATEWQVISEPTCKSEGVKQEVCLSCGKVLNSANIDKIPHKYVDGECTECGAIDESYKPDPDPDPEPEDKYYRISCYDGSTLVFEKMIIEGTSVTSLFVSDIKEPTKKGFRFDGWYLDSEFTKPVTDNVVMDRDIRIYAKFKEINRFIDFNNAFSGVTYVGDNDVITDYDNVARTKTEILNRQFDVLSHNLLMALSNAYGVKENVNLHEQTTKLRTHNINYNDKTIAVFDVNSFLVDYDNIESSHTCGNKFEMDLMCLACYADYYSKIVETNNNFLAYLNNQKSINGGGVIDEYGYVALTKFNYEDRWLWEYEEAVNEKDPLVYMQGYVNKYRERLMLELVKIVANDSSITIDTIEQGYNKINHIGITEQEKEKITNFVLRNIIGWNNVLNDRERKPEHTNLFYIKDYTDENKKFKNYEFLVPAIVEGVLNNTYYNSSRKMFEAKNLQTLINIGENGNVDVNTNKVYVKPKQIDKISGLVINSEGTQTVYIMARINGVIHYTDNITLAEGDNYINLSFSDGYRHTSELGAYNGSNYNVYLNDNGTVDEAKTFGDNFIRIVTSNEQKSCFEIRGILEKPYNDSQIIE